MHELTELFGHPDVKFKVQAKPKTPGDDNMLEIQRPEHEEESIPEITCLVPPAFFRLSERKLHSATYVLYREELERLGLFQETEENQCQAPNL